MGPDVEVIAPPCPAPHPTNESRKNFKTEVERLHLGDFPVGSGINDVESRIGKVAGWRFRLLDEGDNSSFLVQLGDSTSTKGQVPGTEPLSADQCAADGTRSMVAGRCR